jgi:predicted dehydrogenase
LHVLADKPWIIEPEEFPKLQAALDTAAAKRVAAYDAMTQRFEITCLLARALVNDKEIFGACLPGSAAEPAVRMESVHYFLKEVAGVPMLRPAWFFDTRQQGEGLADVGTHLVDLVQWTLFPDQAIDYRRDLAMQSGSHWPTVLTLAQFQRVTGEKAFPASVQSALRDGALECFANNRVIYRLRGVFVQLDIRWDFEAAPGAKDSELAVFQGERARIEVRQGPEEKYVPEVFVLPNRAELKAPVLAALVRRVNALQQTTPGLAIEDLGERLRIILPARHRVGHEAHFELLARQFLEYVRDPGKLPAWEKPNMLAKYYVTTQGVKLARENTRKVKP